MANINKGTVSAILDNGRKVSVKPYIGEIVTFDLVVPFFLLGGLEVGMPVVYAAFDDNTGIVLARMDGEWNHDLSGDITVQGKVKAADFTTDAAAFNTHTHTCPDGTTSGPG